MQVQPTKKSGYIVNTSISFSALLFIVMFYVIHTFCPSEGQAEAQVSSAEQWKIPAVCFETPNKAPFFLWNSKSLFSAFSHPSRGHIRKDYFSVSVLST